MSRLDHRADRALAGLARDPDPSSQPCLDEGALLAYRGGRLPEHEAEEIEAHLADCATCRSLLFNLATAARETQPPRRGRRYVYAVPLAAAAAAAAGFALLTPPSKTFRETIAYDVEVTGEARTMSGVEPKEPDLRIHSGGTITVALIPRAVPAPKPVELAVFSVEHAKLRRLQGASVEKISDGARIRVGVDALAQKGSATLVVAAAAGALELDALAGAEWPAARGDERFAFWTRELRIVEHDEP
jgi:hypothetical protein